MLMEFHCPQLLQIPHEEATSPLTDQGVEAREWP